MKKNFLLHAMIAMAISSGIESKAQNYNENIQKEFLGRGLVAVNDNNHTFLSWRCLPYDNDTYTYNLYKNGVKLTSLFSKTNYIDNTEFSAEDKYQIITTDKTGNIVDTSLIVTPWDNIYKRVHLNRPQNGIAADGSSYSYSPNDCSVGDVDNDGEYEIFVKWEPSNAKDNSQDGHTGPVIIDCYKINGEHLWRINLGENIRAGAHYTQFLVYDFDGDGCAELICKTAPGSIDGKGKYVSEAATESYIKNTDNQKKYANSSGRVLNGPEYLTVFSGIDGHAVHTISYNPPRNIKPMDKNNWGDDYGNRVDRFLACVAYLDGTKPSAVMCRGYYTYAYLWAVDFDGTTLKEKWLHKSENKWQGAYGEGAHNISVGDVDNDGKDEIVYGSASIDHDGKLLYRTGMGHGDALHLSDLCPDIPGLEIFMVHESSPYGGDIRDAKTGKVLNRVTTGRDTGRGVAADIDSQNRGFEYWFSTQSNVYNCEHNVIANKCPSMNFRIYWDGDLCDELLDGTVIDKWNSTSKSSERLFNMHEYANSGACNGSKNTPCLSADILGDWREEVILFDKNTSSDLNIFTTTNTSLYKVPCLMTDHIYRMGIAWQNVGYNQPPHLGYYLPDSINSESYLVNLGDNDINLTSEVNKELPSIYYRFVNCNLIGISGLPEGLKYSKDLNSSTFKINGTPVESGTFTYKIRTINSITKERKDFTATLNIKDNTSAINDNKHNDKIVIKPVFNNEIIIETGFDNTENLLIEVYSINGIKVISENISADKSYIQIKNGVNKLSEGRYIIKISNNNSIIKTCNILKTK